MRYIPNKWHPSISKRLAVGYNVLGPAEQSAIDYATFTRQDLRESELMPSKRKFKVKLHVRSIKRGKLSPPD